MKQHGSFTTGLRLALPAAIGLIACALLFTVARIARADMAPFPGEAGTGLGTAGVTDIRMISETVVLEIADVTFTNGSGFPLTRTGALVTADFLLNNPENNAQSLQVGFPLDVPSQAAGAGGYAKLYSLRAFAGGNEASTQIETVGQETWSAWQMSFAPGNTQVRVTYGLPATVDGCSAELGYVLHTGAAWAGSIGQADLIVRYPYAAEVTLLSPHGIYLGNTTTGYQVAGTDLRWHYDNLEPMPADDLVVTFVTPECWLKVAAARTALNEHATAANYWNLASTYATIVLYAHSFDSPLIAQVADAQYLKALALDPQNPQLNSEYAEFLTYLVGYLLPANRAPSEIQQCVTAMLLAPNDDQLMSTCSPIAADALDGTQAAQSTLTPVLTEVPLPTFTAVTTAATGAVATTPVTASPRPVATATTLPLATATRAATAIAALPASPVSTANVATTAPTSAASPWAPLAFALVALLLLGVGWRAWRRNR